MADNVKLDVVASNPSIKSFEDFDVFSGLKGGVPRDEYKAATFTSTGEEMDARFVRKSKELGSTAAELQAQVNTDEVQPGDKGTSSGTL